MISRLLTIDPGKKSIGWALWSVGSLASCGLFRFETLQSLSQWHRERSGIADLVVCEVPQIYRVSKSKGDPNDLIPVALTAGVCLSAHPVSEQILPRTWKHTIDPDVLDARIRARMSGVASFAECLATVPKSLQHNVVDAVGIGLWWLERNGGVR